MPTIWGDAKRLLAGDWWAADPVPNWHNSRAALGALAAIVLILGVADYATGLVLSLAVLYLVPTAIGTVVAGRRAGVALALESGLVTTVAAFATTSHDDAIYLLNGVALLLILAVIVALISSAQEAALSARDSARQRREFLAYAAHQLRTPLAGIRASTDALLVSGATSQQERLLVNLSREADRAGRLLSSLLQMARVDQGEVPAPQPVDVAELCRMELDRARPGDRGVTTRLVVLAASSEPVLLSGEATRNALANLLDNARRHARSEVTVEVATTPATVEIAVGDDGPGLPEGTRERVFERFVSLDGEGGSGLGLPIARGLIEAQGGRLTYENHRFVIRLPNRRPVAAI
jgi:signal transduction histidine kinase